MAKPESTTKDNCCPITADHRVRLASELQTDAIKDNFPKGIARPALRALVAAGYSSLEELVVISEQELSELHGMGPKAVHLIKKALQTRGLALIAHHSSQGSERSS